MQSHCLEMQASDPHLSQCCLRTEVQKSHKRLELGPLFSYKRLNCKSRSFWVENDVKTGGKKGIKRCTVFWSSNSLVHLWTTSYSSTEEHRWCRDGEDALRQNGFFPDSH